MTEYTGADLFVDALEAYGIEHVFGNPGTTELPLARALEGTDVEYVLGLHEDVAASARANGVDGHTVQPDDDLESALTDAIRTDGPVVVDVPVHD